MRTQDHTFICIDLKSYYASVECVERGLDPLSTNLVVADETRTDNTICLAVSPTLKAYGVPGRGRLREVKDRLKVILHDTGEEVHFIIAPPRMKLYEDVSARIYGVFLKYIAAEDIHVYSIDESFLDVTHYLKLYHMTAHELAIQLVRDVLGNTGITATVGIGPNMYLAKVAMDIVAKKVPADADGVRIAELDEISFREKLWDHEPITDFWGIAGGISSHLAELGVHTMGDLAALSLTAEDTLFQEFGINAEILIDHAWGLEPTQMKHVKEYSPSTSSLSVGQVLKRGYKYQEAKLILREMTEQIIESLVDKGYLAQGLTFFASYEKISDPDAYHGKLVQDWYGRIVPRPAHGTIKLSQPTASPREIMNQMMRLVDEKLDPHLKVRHVGVSAIRLVEECEVPPQISLFVDYKAQQKEIALLRTQLSLHKRFGANSVIKGMDLLEGATTIERNGQIGGHRAG